MQKKIQSIHFLGICGTAMGAAAAALHDRGFQISGSDENIYPPMSDFLAKKGISLSSPYAAENLPSDVDLIVVGNAIRRGNPEVEAVLNQKLYYLSLPEILKEFFLRGRHNLVVSGTHGKTTTTSLLAWILECAGREPGYLIGGLPRNFEQGARLNESKYFVIEGDEYDTAFFDKRSKFIHYLPELLILNNIEFDHADIYHDLEEIKTSFRRLLNIVPSNGMVLLNADDANCVDLAGGCPAPILEVGLNENAALRITDVSYHGDYSRFSLNGEPFEIAMIGEFNVRNTAMAVSAAHFYGISYDEIRKALATFEGVRRRQELRGEVAGIKVIDDFGHHPTAIKQTLEGMRSCYPNERLVAVFEPRSNTTRRAVFQNDLPRALSLADVVVMAQVAKLEQIPVGDRLNPERVVEDIRASGSEAYYEANTDAILERLTELAKAGDVVVIFSNGGFDGLHSRLLGALEARS